MHHVAPKSVPSELLEHFGAKVVHFGIRKGSTFEHLLLFWSILFASFLRYVFVTTFCWFMVTQRSPKWLQVWAENWAKGEVRRGLGEQGALQTGKINYNNYLLHFSHVGRLGKSSILSLWVTINQQKVVTNTYLKKDANKIDQNNNKCSKVDPFRIPKCTTLAPKCSRSSDGTLFGATWCIDSCQEAPRSHSRQVKVTQKSSKS
jgi:hypothetical protein